MRARAWTLSLVVLLTSDRLVSGGAGASDGGIQPGATLELAGDWKYLPYDGPGELAAETLDDSTWPTMALPSSWYLQGATSYPPKARATANLMMPADPGDLPPPPVGVGLDYSGTVWFRRAIRWDGGGGVAVLDLDMVDYDAQVFVNGVAVGGHSGYFQRWSVDVSRALRRGSNLIALRVSAPALAVDLAQQFAISWPKQQNQIKGIFGYHDTRPGATSRRGQERGTGGILRGLSLRVSSGVDLVTVKVTPLDVSERSARLVIEAVTQNWGRQTVDAQLVGVVRPKNFSAPTALPVSFAVRATPGVARSRGEVIIRDPQRWWPWDQGAPNLYQLSATLTAAGTTTTAPPLDSRAVTFGVRSVARDGDWMVTVNGRRSYLRGTNYIATQWLSQADRPFYERDLKLMVAANLNAVRVHAHLERPEFYDLADELGVLVWQDFPLQWGYTELPAFQADARRQAADMIERFYNHPSIFLWCLHNESPHAMEWMKKRDAHQNLALDDALVAVARQQDPARIAHRDSGTGDGHTYFGWYEGRAGDLARRPPKENMITEYGAQALPVIETLRTMFDADTLWPDTPQDWEAWRFADFQPEQTFKLAKIPQGKTIGAFIEASQRYQANLLRFQTEVLRRRKWKGSTGLFQFMFVDDWPAITWSVLDYDRRPKAGYEALRGSMQRLLPSIEFDIHDPTAPIALWVVNDRTQAIPDARVHWTLTGEPAPGTSALPQTRTRTLTIPADDVVKVADLGPLARVAAGSAHLNVWIEDAQGAVLARSRLGREDFLPR